MTTFRVDDAFPLAQINLDDRRFMSRLDREAWETHVQQLMQDIAQQGLLAPVGVARLAGESRYVVVYGFTRSAAVSRLGWPTIRANVYEDLEETVARFLNAGDNAWHTQLTEWERALQLRKLREIGIPVESANGGPCLTRLLICPGAPCSTGCASSATTRQPCTRRWRTSSWGSSMPSSFTSTRQRHERLDCALYSRGMVQPGVERSTDRRHRCAGRLAASDDGRPCNDARQDIKARGVQGASAAHHSAASRVLDRVAPAAPRAAVVATTARWWPALARLAASRTPRRCTPVARRRTGSSCNVDGWRASQESNGQGRTRRDSGRSGGYGAWRTD